MIRKNISQMIGNTPLLELNGISKLYGLKKPILGKIESKNPAGSVKDRVAKMMLDDAEEKGLLKENSTIIEPTSGNTGIALAALAAIKNYKMILTMPDNMSRERIKLMEGYGAKVILTPAKEGMKGAIAKAEELAKEIKDSFIPAQFDNLSNPKAHFETTGPEIWNQTMGRVNIFVAGIGTGGTITGTGKFLKEQNKDIKIVGIEPEKSQVLSGGEANPHGIQGIGAGFIPSILERDIIDEIIPIKDEEAIEIAKLLAIKDGLLSGISSGAAVRGAIEIAQREEFQDKNIVVILPDSGERYLSSALFED